MGVGWGGGEREAAAPGAVRACVRRAPRRALGRDQEGVSTRRHQESISATLTLAPI